MLKIAKATNWSAIAIFVLSLGGLYRFNPNIINGDFLFIFLPYVAGLLAIYNSAKKPVVYASVAINSIALLIYLAILGLVVFWGAAQPIMAFVLISVLCVAPAVVNLKFGVSKIRHAA